MSDGLTERQRKWFASVRESLAAKTGKSLEEWVAVMAACPEIATRTRLKWLKNTHGVGQNYGAMILDAAFPENALGWDDPQALREALWRDAGSLAVLEAIEAMAAKVPDVTSAQRKNYTSFSRKVQFAAMRPLKSGGVVLGLKLDPAVSSRLSQAVRKESWSERLVAVVELADASAVDDEIGRLFAQAADNG
ncbi:DUF4287 domain-containing protein [Brevundimonas sp.]|uniref:DUF4287 domain-containing protein n=1 Tax=Brevundimonas sp. TaxID=1871086 RepID=UPI0028982FE5|nr:DUF4287 domain-containing protein [Brevundimonas sp.]